MTASDKPADAQLAAGALAKLRANIRQLGLLTGLLYLADRLSFKLGFARWIYPYIIVAQPIGTRRLVPESKTASLQVTVLERHGALLDQLPISRAVIDARFAAGSHCVCAARDSELVGCVWYSLGSHTEDEVNLRYLLEPSSRTAWDFDVFIPEKRRGGLAFALTWQVAEDHLASKGVSWSLSRITAFNVKSVSAHERLGARRIGRIVSFAIGPWQLSFSSFRPRASACHAAGPRTPELRIRAPMDSKA